MYYNYDSSDDEWPEVRYRRLVSKNKSFPTNQDVFDIGESKLENTPPRNRIGKAEISKPSSSFTDSIDRPYISRDGNIELKQGQNYKWANQSANMFNTNIDTNIDTRVTRFISNKAPFTYAASRMQEYGSDIKPNYISPPSNKYCKGSIPGINGCMIPSSKKENFTDTPETFTSEAIDENYKHKHKHMKCCKHNNDIGAIIDALTSPLFLMIILLVILVYVVELLRNVREMIVALHHSSKV